MDIFLVGLNHKTAPLSIREKLSFTEKKREAIYRSFREKTELESVVVLSTCNRTELYGAAYDSESAMDALKGILTEQAGDNAAKIAPYLYQKRDEEALSHLFSVSSGLDSMLLGETQILGQLKDAYLEAGRAGAVDGITHMMMQSALSCGKKVRSRTRIDQHPISVSYMAVERAKTICGSIRDKKVLVVGAGSAGKLAARYLKDEGVSAVVVSNRSAHIAKMLAAELDGEAVSFEELPAALFDVDVVISCTGASHLVIHGGDCENAIRSRKGRPLTMIDIAVPRDIDPAFGKIEGVSLLDMDAMQKAVEGSLKAREEAADRGAMIVDEEVDTFKNRLKRREEMRKANAS